MPSFKATITAKDLFYFNIRHAYTHFQGILTIVFGLVLIGLAIFNFKEGNLSPANFGIYMAISLLFMLYVPFSLYSRSINRMKKDIALANELKYTLNDEGVLVESEAAGEKATLPWEYVFKVKTVSSYLLIYSNRVNAYIIPKSAVKSVYPQVKAAFESHLQDYRLELNWK